MMLFDNSLSKLFRAKLLAVVPNKLSYSAVYFFLSALLIQPYSLAAKASPADSGKPQAITENTVWITLGEDAYSRLKTQYAKQIHFSSVKQPANRLSANTQSVAVAIPETQLAELSQIMHTEFMRCAGFFYHDSEAEAVRFLSLPMKNSSQMLLAYTINNGTVVEALRSQLVPANMAATVASMSDYFNRYYAVSTGQESAIWLQNQWQAITRSRADISVELFSHASWLQPSVVVTIPGTINPEQVVVLGGHLDSINRTSPENGRAPGADDNASGIAVITEALRAVVATDYRPARTLKLIGYAAEEVGLRGSQQIASEYKNDGVDVVGAIQFDMAGYKGSNNLDVVFIEDFTDRPQTDFLKTLLATYFPDTQIGNSVCGYACSDHASWTAQGYAASFPFESTFNLSNPDIHTSRDLAFDIDHATHFLQLAIAYIAELAKGQIGEQDITSLQFTATELSVAEEESVTLTVERRGQLDSAVSVSFETQDGSAMAGQDYTAASGTLSWQAQDSASQTIIISTRNVSHDKWFRVELLEPQGGAVVGVNAAVNVTISNLDPEERRTSSGGGGALSLMVLFLLGLTEWTTGNRRRVDTFN